MTFPYSYRIVICLDGHSPIELYRSPTKLTPKKLRLYTAELSREWTVDIQHFLLDRHCISRRPVFARPTGTEKLRFHLTKEQKDKLYDTH